MTSAVDIFQDIPFKLHRIKTELKKFPDLGIVPPKLGTAPYSIAIYDNIRSFQKEVNQHFEEYTKDIKRIVNKLSIDNKYLESLLSEYTGMKQKKSDKAYIFSFQAEYSFLTLKLSRMQKQLESPESNKPFSF